MQIRLRGFDHGRLVELGGNVRSVFAAHNEQAERVLRVVDDAYLSDLADAVAGRLGGQVGIAPRLFLKKPVGDVLDRVEMFDDFDPRRDYALTVADGELSDVERNAERGLTPDDVELNDIELSPDVTGDE